VDPTDPAAIAAGLLRILGPDSEWERFRDAGRRRVLERYTWETTAEGYRGVLEEILRTETALPEGLPIPVYFMSPGPDTDIGIDILRGIVSPPPASAS
jgi:sucrose-phosphate synthase